MGFLIKLAFKNLSRHKLRTFISMIAIAFSVLIVVFARGYITGLIDSVSADNIQYNSGHIKIVKENYYEQSRLLPLDYPVDGFNGNGLSNMIDRLENVEGVQSAIPRLKFGAMASREGEMINMMGWGIIPGKELEYTDVENFIVEGRMVNNGEKEIVMGTKLLKDVGKEVGDKITIVYNTSYNSLQGTTFKIVGRFETGLRLLNEVVFYLPLDLAQEKLYMDDMTTELLLMTGSSARSLKILPEIRDIFKEQYEDNPYKVLSYREANELIPWMEMASLIYNEIYIFLVLLASIVVVNTMIMIVRERTQEVGMMKAMGLEGRDILYLFTIEGAIMGIFGSFAGALTGSLLNGYFAENGLNLTSVTSGFNADLVFNAYIYTNQSLSNTMFAFVLGIVIVTLACLIPAVRASKLEPTDAMREI
ncbi:MAG: FtsX-like permease family protein [candidate division WOR-3 bacterium]|nr:FtsX-like permease family protein [candidate division WOR-3 bacterium]